MTTASTLILELKSLLNRADKLPSVNRELTDNIFSILKMENKEVSTHSAFLSYLFEDKASLQLFIQKVLKISAVSDNVSFDREYLFDDGRIDFVFWIDGKPLALELKVWAGEQDLQIERYTKFIERYGGSENDVYFLTPVKRTSKTGKSINITFNNELNCWLKEIELSASGDRKILIKQYRELINFLCGEHMDEIQQLSLITDKNDFENINKLIEVRRTFSKNVLKTFFSYLRDNLELSLNACNLQVAYRPADYEQEAIHGYYNDNAHYYPQLFYRVVLSDLQRNQIGLSDDENLYYAVELSKSLYYGFTVRKNTGEKVNNPERFYDLCDFCSRGLNAVTAKNNTVWIAYKYNQRENKTFDFANFNSNWFSLIVEMDGAVDEKYVINERLKLNARVVDDLIKEIINFYNKGIGLLLEYANEK